MITTMILVIIACFFVCLLLGSICIPMLHKLKYGQQVRDDGPQSHLSKAGTPTMGGVIILIGLLASLLFAPSNRELMVGIGFTVAFGLVGFADDYIKIVKKRSLGLKPMQKIVGQLALAIGMAFYASSKVGTQIWVPFTEMRLELGMFYIPLMVFVVIGAVNSVNLTDGLDGLASGVMLVVSAAYALIFYHMAEQGILPMGDANGLLILTCGFCGCLMGFLRFNMHPAKVFMGDTGSLALGGGLAYMALCSDTVLLLPIMGGCFVASAVSDILQVGSYKLRHGKRVLKMAPLHHHFELCGIPETKVVGMYVLTTVILCLIGLLALV